MEAFEFLKKVEGGKIIIELPQDFEGKNFKIKVTEDIAIETDPEDWATLPSEERLKILQQFKGTAKYPDVQINKYDVYEQ